MKQKSRSVVIILVSALLVASSLACVCPMVGWPTVRGSGRVIEEEREVSGFTGVSLANFGNLYIQIGDKEALRVEAEDNLMQYLETGVDGGTLKIGTRYGVSLHPTRPVNFYLTAKELDTIALSGSGDIEAPGLEAERFSVSISGSGNVVLESLNTSALDVQISGSGELDILGGKIGEQDITIGGSGEYRAEDSEAAEAERVVVRMSGSGDVRLGELRADLLDARISGSGDLYVLGGAVEAQEIAIYGSGEYKAERLESARAEVHISGSGSAAVQVRDSLEAGIVGSGDIYYVGSPVVKRSVAGSGDIEWIGD